MPNYTHEELENLLDGDPVDGLKVVDNVYRGQGRWMSRHQLVFTDQRYHDTYWSVDYELPMTELQEGSVGPFEYQPNPVTPREVRPQEITVTEWCPT